MSTDLVVGVRVGCRGWPMWRGTVTEVFQHSVAVYWDWSSHGSRVEWVEDLVANPPTLGAGSRVTLRHFQEWRGTVVEVSGELTTVLWDWSTGNTVFQYTRDIMIISDGVNSGH